MRRKVESSGLDEEACGFQREHLIADAEVRRLEPLNDHERRLEVPGQDEDDNERHDRVAKLGVVPPWSARHLLALGHRHVDVTAALVVGVHRHGEGAVLVVFALVLASFVIAHVRVTVPTRGVTTLFVRPAILNGNAKHMSRSKRGQALHEEQEHGDKFDQNGGHR